MLSVPGNVLVFFKSMGCAHSAQIYPSFTTLASQDQRIHYATVDLSYNRKLIEMSNNTTTPLRETPKIILYMNHKPCTKYNGRGDFQSLRDFITTSLEKVIEPQRSFVAPTPTYTYTQEQYGVNPGPNAYSPHQPNYPPQNYTAPNLPQNVLIPPHHRDQRTVAGPPVSYPTSYDPYPDNGDTEEDDPSLVVPEDFIPHNTPWHLAR